MRAVLTAGDGRGPTPISADTFSDGDASQSYRAIYVILCGYDTTSGGRPVPLACVTDSDGRGYLAVTTSAIP